MTGISCDSFVYDIRYEFQASKLALIYDVCDYIYDNHPAISFGDRTGQSLHGDLAEIVRKPHSHCAAIVYSNALAFLTRRLIG